MIVISVHTGPEIPVLKLVMTYPTIDPTRNLAEVA